MNKETNNMEEVTVVTEDMNKKDHLLALFACLLFSATLITSMF